MHITPPLLKSTHRSQVGAMREIRIERSVFGPAQTDADYAEAAKATRRLEVQRRHVLELETKALSAVQDLEVRLGTTRWVPGDEKWVEVEEMVRKRSYRRALDHLEKLIIQRMFELAKCNMSGTGTYACNIKDHYSLQL